MTVCIDIPSAEKVRIVRMDLDNKVEAFSKKGQNNWIKIAL
ncbi:hypothetical protein HanRHA438_Chr02g0057051 [Helianthus annuus]|uniref:Uncharacterized protein n=1 Tax=Helianthus annuus TaxID=4232 RepID=A0A9K3I6P7_HELAN|nr:hypothetical protein HanXRQr2_Chr09g0391621 [Helianthus annuus]KAJ0542676.1 hypothetical protein HanHA89_Chr09g0342361 [Helianthus annuus]KAJ0604073.1 hypothetical protein HanHA300_Chr02g0045541 [Helianthus annuus]KAJ0707058.1 hypothetical protein HanLR1_Chr09g0314211 [Helianthus annuus]KAJ0893437.1 hypothetical protein HanPSC8_Chr09g0377591 [Helianthus annuus]